jgi:hypothetical protein
MIPIAASTVVLARSGHAGCATDCSPPAAPGADNGSELVGDSPAAILANVARRGFRISVGAGKLYPVDFRCSLAPRPANDVGEAVIRYKPELTSLLTGDELPTTTLQLELPFTICESLRQSDRVAVEFVYSGLPTPFRGRVSTLILSGFPGEAFVVNVRAAEVLVLKDILGQKPLVGWDADCTRLGLLQLLLTPSHRPIRGIMAGAGIVFGTDGEQLTAAARRAAWAYSVASA